MPEIGEPKCSGGRSGGVPALGGAIFVVETKFGGRILAFCKLAHSLLKLVSVFTAVNGRAAQVKLTNETAS